MFEMLDTGMLSKWCVIIGCMLFTACSGDEDGKSESPRTYDMRLSFKVMTNSSVHSRIDNTWGDPYEKDVAFDFEDEVRGVEAFLYLSSAEGNFLVRLDVINEESDPTKGNFTVGFDCSSDWLTVGADGRRYLSGRLVVVANCGAASGNVLESVPFCRLQTAAPVDATALRNTSIPMWGCCTLKDIPVVPNGVYPLEEDQQIEVDLLRSMAKITIKLAANIRDKYKLLGASLCGYQEYGNVVPNEASGVENTKALGVDKCFNPAGNRVSESPYPLTPYSHTVREDNTEVTVSDLIGYFPEIKNPGRSKLYLKVDIADSDGMQIEVPEDEFRIYFTEYDNGKPVAGNDKDYDIVRNHSYIFTITDVTGLFVTYTVCVWEDREAGDIHFD